jgi:hypothetical protein
LAPRKKQPARAAQRYVCVQPHIRPGTFGFRDLGSEQPTFQLAAPVKREFLDRCESSIRNLRNLKDSFLPSENGDPIPDHRQAASHLPPWNLDQQRFHQGLGARAAQDQMNDMYRRAFSNLAGPVQLHPPGDLISTGAQSVQPASPIGASAMSNASVCPPSIFGSGVQPVNYVAPEKRAENSANWATIGSGMQPTQESLGGGLTGGQSLTGLADKDGSECVGESNASMHHSPSKDSFVQPLKITKGITAAARAKMRREKATAPQDKVE